MVTAGTALAAMLWQYAHPPETLERLYLEDPRLRHFAVDLVPQLTRLLEDIMTGMLLKPQQN